MKHSTAGQNDKFRTNLDTLVQVLNEKAWNCMLEDPKRALAISEEAYDICLQSACPIGLADCILNTGWCYTYIGEYDRSLAKLSKALSLFQRSTDSYGELMALNALGVAYQHLGQFETALQYHTHCLVISRENEDRERELVALNNIGEVCEDLENFEEALSYLSSALLLAVELSDNERTGTVLINLGFCHYRLGTLEKADQYLREGLIKTRTVNDLIGESRCLTLLGLVLQDSGETDVALDYHRRSLRLSEEIDNRPGRIEALKNLGRLLFVQGNPEPALSAFRQALHLSETIGSKKNMYGINRLISEVFEKQGEYGTALAFFTKYHILEKEVFTEETNRRIETLTLQYESDKNRHQAEIYRLRNKELRQKSSDLEVLYDKIRIISRLGQKITAILDLERLLYTIYESINELMDASAFGIAVYDNDKKTISFKLSMEKGKRLPEFTTVLSSRKSYAAWCIRNRKEIVINDIESESADFIRRQEDRSSSHSESVVYLPLLIEDRIIGAFTVQSSRKNAYKQVHLESLRALAAYIAIALENSLVHKEVNQLNDIIRNEKIELESVYDRLEHMANHDSLTGLANRRLLIELLDKYIPLAERNDGKLAVFYLDLDGFKSVNDDLGHIAGDSVLKMVAERLSGALRESDTLARFGGDEFVAVVQYFTGKRALATIARKIRSTVAACPYLIDNREIKIDISIGIAVFPEDETTTNGLLRKADSAMFTAKRSGPGKFEFYSDRSGVESDLVYSERKNNSDSKLQEEM